jgi:pimeloyl-ACP methyl ester carboxylesterase
MVSLERSRQTVVASGAVELSIQEDGPADSQAPPIVMLHGCARSGSIWSGWIPVLGQNHRILRPDIRGCGSSSDPGADYVFRIDDLVADLLAIMDELGLEQVHYVGESAGGVVGAIAAARHPSRFRSLTLVSTPISPSSGDMKVKSPGGAASPEEAFAKLGLKEWWLQSRRRTGDLFGDDRDDEIASDFARTPLHVAISMWTAMHQPDVSLAPYLSRLFLPTLVLSPTASYTMNLEQQRDLVSALPNARQIIYQNAPHFMIYLRAAELARDTLEFIESHDGR